MKVIFVFLALFGSFFLLAQSTVLPVYGIIKDLDSGKKLGGVQVAIFSGSTKVKSSATASNGKYDLSVPINAVYTVKYTKAGYVTKIVQIDVTGINDEDLPPGELPQPSIDLDLFTNRPNVDFSFTNSDPVASFFYDNKGFKMDYKRSEAMQMRTKIDDLLASAEVKEKQNEAAYNEWITKADLAFSQEKYEEAQTAYTAALKLKPTEAHPSNRLVEIDDLLAAIRKENLLESQANQAYQNLITAGDNLLNAKEYDKAIAKYNQAAIEKPNEQLPRDKVSEANSLKKAAENKEKYDALIKMADGFMKQNSLQAARDKYTQATKLDPSQTYPKEQLAKIAEGLKAKEELTQKKHKYTDAVEAGDKLLAEKKFSESKSKYEEALTYESAATYPRAKIKEIDLALEKLAAENELEAQFLKVIKEADDKMLASDYDGAIKKYEEAVTVKESTTYIETQIKKAKEAIALLEKEAEQKAMAEKYQKQVEAADQLYSSMKYEEAIVSYELAKKIKPTDSYPDVQIEKANAKIKEAKEKAALEEIENAFSKIKVEADELFASQRYSEAKSKYLEALKVKSSSEVDAQLEKIEKELQILAENENKKVQIQELFDRAKDFQEKKVYSSEIESYQAILSLDPLNSKAKELLVKANLNLKEANLLEKKEVQFRALKSEGDALFVTENYLESKVKYTQALELQEDASVKSKLLEIDNLLKQKAATEKQANKIEELFNSALVSLSKEQFDEAITSYQSILELDSDNDKASQGLESAKLARANKAEMVARDAQFEKLKSAGIQLLAQGKLEEAKESLLAAKELKEDQKVLASLAEIEVELANRQSQEERDLSYSNAIKEGESLEKNDDLLSAIEKYQEALAYKPNDTVATNKVKDLQIKLAAFDKSKQNEEAFNLAMQNGNNAFENKEFIVALASYESALQLKVGNNEAKQKIEETKFQIELNAKNETENKRFENLMIAAKAKGDNNDLDAALSLYEQALELKPDNESARNAIDAIYALNEIKKKEATAKENQAKLNQQYSAKMSEGNVAFQNKNYKAALSAYTLASTLKPSETLPKDKIKEIEKLLNDKEESDSITKQFEALTQEANKLFDSKKYQESIDLYEKALLIKDDSAVRKKINLAESALENTRNAENESNYLEIINSANSLFSQRDYTDALKEYKNALELKPEDTFVQDKISEVEQILDNLNDEKNIQVENQAKFKALLKEGDEYFEAKRFIEAKKKYETALLLFPNDVYTNNQLTKSIENSKRAAVDSGNKQYQKIIDKADEYFNASNWSKAKSLYKRALKLKSYDKYPQDQLKEIIKRENQSLVENVDLENLGESEEISILEGAALLLDAENKREQNKKQTITDQITAKRKKTEALNYNDDEERIQTNEAAEKARKLIELESLEGDARRQSNAVAVDDKVQELAQKNAQQSVYERGEVLRLAQDIDFVDNQIASERAREIETYKEKAKQLDGVSLEMAQFHQEELLVELDRTKRAFEDISVEIKKTSSTKNTDEEYAQIQKIQKSVQLAEIEMYENSMEKQVIQKALENEIKLLRGEAQRKAAQEETENNLASLTLNETLSTSRKVIQEFHNESDANRKLTLDKIDRKELELNEATRIAAQKEKQQIEDNELSIEQTKAIIAQKKKDETKEILALRQQVVESAEMVQRANKTKSDLEKQDRQNTFQSLESTEALRSSITTKQTNQTKQNNEGIKALHNSVGRDNAIQSELNKLKVLERQKIIDGFENNSTKFTESIANTLGEEFPEGVSQEVFVRNDDDGLPVKIVTRRVVVKNGRGEVYIRTQTKFGLTFTKNGNAITKQSWVNGTENATLTKNY